VTDLKSCSPAIAVQIASRRVAIAVLALERYRRAHAGALLKSLSDLAPSYVSAVPVDPFSGQALRYVTGTESYKIYSVGTNRTDDGGDWSDTEREAPRPKMMRPMPKDLGLEIPIRRRSDAQ
jgi:hypothetical protein